MKEKIQENKEEKMPEKKEFIKDKLQETKEERFPEKKEIFKENKAIKEEKIQQKKEIKEEKIPQSKEIKEKNGNLSYISSKIANSGYHEEIHQCLSEKCCRFIQERFCLKSTSPP